MTILSRSQAAEIIDSSLDDIYEPTRIGCLTFYASAILKEMDPVAYNIELNDFIADLEDQGYVITE